jgi:hypothetical protein
VTDRREQRRKLKEKYGVFFDEVAAILFRHDPEGINYGFNTDEYEPETGTIIPRLESCANIGEVRRVVHEEFRRWFAPGFTHPEEHFEAAANDIWNAWQQYRRKSEPA